MAENKDSNMPKRETELERVARQSKEFREQESKRIAEEKEDARLAFEQQKQEERKRVAQQSGAFLVEAAKEREKREKAKRPKKKSIVVEDVNVSGKAKQLLEKEEAEQRRIHEQRELTVARKVLSKGAVEAQETQLETVEMESSIDAAKKDDAEPSAKEPKAATTEAAQRVQTVAEKETVVLAREKMAYGETVSASSADNQYVQSLVVRKFDRASIPRQRKIHESSDEDDLLMERRVQKEASFEIPLEYTGEGFKLLRDAEVTMVTSMPSSRVNGPWSGKMEGKSSLGSSESAATGSVSLEYKSSRSTRLNMGMIRGHEIHHPLITFGGSLVRGGSAVGVNFYHNATFLQAMLLEHSMYSLSFRHLFPKSRWFFNSELSSRQELLLSLSNSKMGGSVDWNLRKPKEVSLRLDVRPKISEHRRAHLFFQRKLASWQVGATLVQSLHSQIATVGLGVRLISTRGLEWMLSWNRGDASMRVPIVVASGLQNVHLGQVLYFSMVSFLIQEGLAEMWGWKSNKSGELEKSLQEPVVDIKKAREDAELQSELMARQAKRKKREEIEKEGLVIHKAIYQVEGGDEWEATNSLQFWVSKSSLSLPATSKSQLLGFYDITTNIKTKKKSEISKADTPVSWWADVWNELLDLTPKVGTNNSSAKGPVPTLTVRYDYKGQLYGIKVKDNEALILPNPKATRL